MKTKNNKQGAKKLSLRLREEDLLTQIAFLEASKRLDVNDERDEELAITLLAITDKTDIPPDTLINTLKIITVMAVRDKYKGLSTTELQGVWADFEDEENKFTSKKYSMRERMMRNLNQKKQN